MKTAHHFYYSADGHGFCSLCVTGEDIDLDGNAPNGYEPVPADHLDMIQCENCGAVHASNPAI